MEYVIQQDYLPAGHQRVRHLAQQSLPAKLKKWTDK